MLKTSVSKLIAIGINKSVRHVVAAEMHEAQRGFVFKRNFISNIAEVDAFARIKSRASPRAITFARPCSGRRNGRSGCNKYVKLNAESVRHALETNNTQDIHLLNHHTLMSISEVPFCILWDFRSAFPSVSRCWRSRARMAISSTR